MLRRLPSAAHPTKQRHLAISFPRSCQKATAAPSGSIPNQPTGPSPVYHFWMRIFSGRVPASARCLMKPGPVLHRRPSHSWKAMRRRPMQSQPGPAQPCAARAELQKHACLCCHHLLEVPDGVVLVALNPDLQAQAVGGARHAALCKWQATIKHLNGPINTHGASPASIQQHLAGTCAVNRQPTAAEHAELHSPSSPDGR